MCKNLNELSELVETLRGLKAMKHEIEDEISSIQAEILQYMKDEKKDSITGSNFTVKYSECSRTSFSKKALQEVLGEDLSKFQTTSTYDRLYIS